MSALQWALLILSVAIVVAVVVISRRDRGLADRAADEESEKSPVQPEREQLDIFASVAEPRSLHSRTAPLFEAFEQSAPKASAGDVESPMELGVVSKPRKLQSPPVSPLPAAAAEPPVQPGAPEPDLDESPLSDAPLIARLGNTQFDEFGVGRPRRRVSPSLDFPDEPEPAAAPPPERLPPWARAPSAPAPTPVTTKPATPPAAEPPVAAASVPKIVSLLIVERAGGLISGTKLHTVLSAQGLSFGSKQIYHRMVRDQAVFSVASLTKPGVLVPADAATFATPGLSVFMILPGPVKPVTALHDLLATAQALARALNAEVYDSKKQPLSSELMRALQADVEAWARTTQG